MDKDTAALINQVESHGLKVRLVSVERLGEIREEIESIGKTHQDVHTSIVEYINKLDFKVPDHFSEVQSILVVAVPQPIHRLHFTLGEKKHAVIMPPTYLFDTSSELGGKHKRLAETTRILEEVLFQANYQVIKINLPSKLIAVKSGLAQYGRNNICYVNSEGSFFWIGTYLTNMPCECDSWQEYTVMKRCENCDLCRKNCHTGAIAEDRFIIHADKCITLHNDRSGDFPEWIDPKWHNSIMGCMRCQIICPANKDFIKNIEDHIEFDHWETEMILRKAPLEQLPESTYKKLESIININEYDLLVRNLSVLIGGSALDHSV